MNPYQYFRVLDMHGALKKWAASFQSSAGGKKRDVIGSWGLRRGIKQKEREKKNPRLCHIRQLWSVFAGTEQRRESMDVKWFKRPGRGRKVQEGTPDRVSVITRSLCTLPNPLLNFPSRPSPWQKFKWIKSKPAEAHCFRGLWWMKKTNQMISILKHGQSCCWLLDVND